MPPVNAVRDNYNRADAASLGSNYTDYVASGFAGNIGIASNQAAGQTAGNNLVMWNVNTDGPDCESAITINTKPANGAAVALYLRGQQISNILTIDGYLCAMITDAGTDIFRIQRIDNAVATTLGADITQEFTAGNSFRFSAVGSTLTVEYFNGTSWSVLGSRTDSTYTAAGNPGLLMVGTTARVDNWIAGTLYAHGKVGQQRLVSKLTGLVR